MVTLRNLICESSRLTSRDIQVTHREEWLTHVIPSLQMLMAFTLDTSYFIFVQAQPLFFLKSDGLPRRIGFLTIDFWLFSACTEKTHISNNIFGFSQSKQTLFIIL